MRIAVFYEDNDFGHSFRASLLQGLHSNIHAHELIGEYKFNKASDLMKIIDGWSDKKPDLIVGPNTSSVLSELFDSGKLAGIPVVSTQATSTALEKRGYEGYFQLAVSDSDRVVYLLKKLATFYFRFRDVYLFTKTTDNAKSFSSSLRTDFINRYVNDEIFKNHVFVDHHFSIEEDKENIITDVKLDPGLKINFRYPIVICAESTPTVHLVKKLRDIGIKNTIFAFGTGEYMRKRIMKGAYLLADKNDTEVPPSEEAKEQNPNAKPLKKNDVSYELGIHLLNSYHEGFDLTKFKQYVADFKKNQSAKPPIRVRRLRVFRKSKTTKIYFSDFAILWISLFTRRILESEKLLSIVLALVAILLTVITIIQAYGDQPCKGHCF